MYLFDFCGVPKNAQEDQTPDEFYRGQAGKRSGQGD